MSKVENPAVISRPVWFVREGNILYLLPLNGSDTNWYKNMLVNPMSKLSLNGTEILSANGRPITDKNRVAYLNNNDRTKNIFTISTGWKSNSKSGQSW
jgi:hypothetical protein